MVAYIRKMAVERNRWLDEATFRDGVALCQTIPGAIAMQTAAYVGLRSRGLPGAAVCFVGFGLPAFCFMAILSACYARTHDLPLVLATFAGLQAVTVAIVANATITFGKRSVASLADVIIAALAAVMLTLKVNPIVAILLAALMGIVLYRGRTKDRGRDRSHAMAAGRDSNAPDTIESCPTDSLRGPTSKPQATDGAAFCVRPRWRMTPLLLVVAAGFALLFVASRGLFDLAALMFRIDLFAFGGGFASVPLMYHEVVDVRSWMDGETFMNGIALGQVTPGPIVITATFVGYLLYGIAGAVVATASVFLPSFLMVVGVVPYFDRLRASDYFRRCMSSILASFVGLLLSVTLQFALDVPWDVPRLVLAVVALAALLLRADVLWVVLAAIAVSLLIL